MVGWGLDPLLDWQIASPHTIPHSPCDFNSDVIYVLPQLSAANLAYTRLPNACLNYLAAPVFR